MYIGNIIYENDLVKHGEVEYVKYFYKNDLNDIDFDLPTLYVGWKLVKEYEGVNKYVNNLNILKNVIESNRAYWTFSFEEEKAAHVKGVERFVDNVPYYYFKSRYQYINLDPVFHNISNEDDLFNTLPKDIIKTYILKDRMLYVLSSDNKIYGIDLEMYKFFNFNIDSLKRYFREKTLSCFEDADGEKYQTYYKIFPNFTFLKRYLVVLY